MSRAFIVTEKHFEYNDEVYSTGDGDSGNPVKVYTDRAKAQAEANLLDRKKFRGETISNYAYDITDLSSLDESEIKTRLGEIFDTESKARRERRQVLEKQLGVALKGKALAKAVEAALDTELPQKTPSVELDGWECPANATDEQIDAVRKVFDGLSFYEVVETDLD